MLRILVAAALGCALLLGGSAEANLIVNGGFETGNFSGWTRGGNLSGTSVSNRRPHSGTFAAELGPVFTPGFLSQTVPTVAGLTYDFSFWLRADSNLPTPARNFFRASLNGAQIYSEIVPARGLGHGYQFHLFSFEATGPITAIRFDFRHDFGFFTLDDVEFEVNGAEVPEPATLALTALGIGLAAVHVVRRQRKA